MANTTTPASNSDSSTITSAPSTITPLPTETRDFQNETYTGTYDVGGGELQAWCYEMSRSWEYIYATQLGSSSTHTDTDTYEPWTSSGIVIPATTVTTTLSWTWDTFSPLSQYISKSYTPPWQCVSQEPYILGSFQS